MRQLFRTFWRVMYFNPHYLRYSGTWDTTYVDGQPRKAKWNEWEHWKEAFRDEWFMYRHPAFRTKQHN